MTVSDARFETVRYSPDGDRMVVAGANGRLQVFSKRRPEWWWGIFWLWEFWLTVAFAALFIWSVLRDRRSLAPSA